MLDKILLKIRGYIPEKLFKFSAPIYHWKLAFISALIYRFPSRKIKVIAVTGTKGKSSTTEILNAILEKAGYKTALSNTIRFKIGNTSRENLYKMSMPGRFFAQRFIRQAVDANCQYLIMEMTSQGAELYRHRFIELDVLIFTNISPEHIEAHGSYENYLNAKLSIARNMSRSRKNVRTIISNSDDEESYRFMENSVERKISFSVKDVEPYNIGSVGLEFVLDGKAVVSPLSGLFNLYNILAAASAAKSQGIDNEIIIRSIEKFDRIPGRVQKIMAHPKQDFDVVVDYAHTADSLEKFYNVFKAKRNICVLGGTGGGRDTLKRTEMGHLADIYCKEIILTDEDPYDENQNEIIQCVAKGIKEHIPTIIIDRKQAIFEAVKRARPGDAVLITGKGTDPYIMGPKGMKTPWSDANVAKEAIENKYK